jgi:uncharacterized membrane protein YdbT with pleckstrin-like domain
VDTVVLLLLVSWLAGIAVLLVRFVRAHGVERQQLKVFLYALGDRRRSLSATGRHASGARQLL